LLIWAIQKGNVRHAFALLGNRQTLSADEAIEIFKRHRFDMFQKLREQRPGLHMLDLSGRSSTGTTVLESAICEGTPETTLMLEHWASAYDASKLRLAVEAALKTKESWLVERLLHSRPKSREPKCREGTAIAMAAGAKEKAILYLLLDHLPRLRQCIIPEDYCEGYWGCPGVQAAALSIPVYLGNRIMLDKFLARGYKANRVTLVEAV